MLEYLKLIRINHWIKNLFVFAALFFHGDILNPDLLVKCLWVFLSFCFMASSVYIWNDYLDIKLDQQHPEKKRRPLASGAIKPGKAFAISSFLFLLTIAINLLVIKNSWVFVIILLYALNNILYSLVIKKFAVADIASIAAGFVLRVVAGGVVTAIPLSNWLILMTFLLALFLGLAKRHDDVVLMNESGIAMRHSIRGYNKRFIDAAMTMMCSVLITCYLMYLSSIEITRLHTPYIFLTAIPVVLGILRYMQLTFVKEKSGSPVKILYKDLFLQLCLLVWVLAFFYFLYYY